MQFTLMPNAGAYGVSKVNFFFNQVLRDEYMTNVDTQAYKSNSSFNTRQFTKSIQIVISRAFRVV